MIAWLYFPFHLLKPLTFCKCLKNIKKKEKENKSVALGNELSERCFAWGIVL